MNPIYAILLDVAIIWFFFGNNIRSLFRTKRGKVAFELKEFSKMLKNTILRDRDILCAADRAFLDEELEMVRAASSDAEKKECLAHLNSESVQARIHRIRRDNWLRSNLELAIVAVGVAFGIRALFIQPFKIPTGSMQPTLYGIHYEEQEEPLPTARWQRIFNYINYSQTPVEWTADKAGTLNPESIRAVQTGMFSAKTAVEIGGVQYIVPGSVSTIQRVLYEKCILEKKSLGFEAGERILHGTLQTGDHLFVNRLSLCFQEPKRGDVMVFITDGLDDPDGTGFGGRFYIKRLVGLPGDTLQIREGRLYLKPDGATDFALVDEKIHPSFAKINSMQNKYNGYANMSSAAYLATPEDTFTVPKGRYFMLGDNTLNSKDSRYWGTVPRRNLVGKPCFVWYPFSKRFGLVDRN